MSFFTLHSTHHTWQATDRRVIGAEELPVFESIFELTVALESQIRQVQEAREEAVAQGFRQGYKEAREQVRRRADDKLAEQLLAQAEDYQALVAEQRRSVVELALEVTRKIAGKVGQQAWLLAQANEAAQALVDAGSVTLVVSEPDYPVVQSRLAADHETPFTEVMCSDELASGECLLQTPAGRVRLSLNSQLAKIRSLLADDKDEPSNSNSEAGAIEGAA